MSVIFKVKGEKYAVSKELLERRSAFIETIKEDLEGEFEIGMFLPKITSEIFISGIKYVIEYDKLRRMIEDMDNGLRDYDRDNFLEKYEDYADKERIYKELDKEGELIDWLMIDNKDEYINGVIKNLGLGYKDPEEIGTRTEFIISESSVIEKFEIICYNDVIDLARWIKEMYIITNESLEDYFLEKIILNNASLKMFEQVLEWFDLDVLKSFTMTGISGNLEIMKWYERNGLVNNMNIALNLLELSRHEELRNYEVLEYMYESGKITEEVLEMTTSGEYENIYDEMLFNAIEYGNIGLVKWIVGIEKLNEFNYECAFRHGLLMNVSDELLDYMKNLINEEIKREHIISLLDNLIGDELYERRERVMDWVNRNVEKEVLNNIIIDVLEIVIENSKLFKWLYERYYDKETKSEYVKEIINRSEEIKGIIKNKLSD